MIKKHKGRLLTTAALTFYILFPSLMAQQTGRVEYSILANPSIVRFVCSPDDILAPVPALQLQVQNLTPTTQSANFTTTTNGFYTIPATYRTSIRVTPPVVNTPRGLVTTFDIAVLQKHVLRIAKLACPFLRIAGDVDNDGKLTLSDGERIRDYILRRTTVIGTVPFVRFVSKAYVMPHGKHPDQQFVADFWNNDYTDPMDKEYPFNAKIKYNGKIYDYNSTQSWMNKLNEWRFPGDSCESRNWGFIAIVSGDLGANALPTSSSTPAPIISTTQFSRTQVAKQGNKEMPLTAATADSLPTENELVNQEYKVTVVATTQEKVNAFQLQANTNNDLVKIVSIAASSGQMTTDWAKNMNQEPTMLKEGKLRMLWVSGLEGNSAAFVMTDTPLFSFAVTADKLRYLQNVGLDTVEFPALFYNEEGKEITAQVQFKIEKTN